MSALRPGSCRTSPPTSMGATRTSATTASSTRMPRSATDARSRWRPTRPSGSGGGRHHHRGHVVALRRLAAELDHLAHDALDRGSCRSVPALAPHLLQPLLAELLLEAVHRLRDAVAEEEERVARSERNLGLVVARAVDEPERQAARHALRHVAARAPQPRVVVTGVHVAQPAPRVIQLRVE